MAPHVGLQYAPTAQIALVQSLTPLLTAALGVVLLHEHLRPWQWAGLVLVVIGVGLVVGQAAVQDPIPLEAPATPFLGLVGLVSGRLVFRRFLPGFDLLPG